MARLKKLNDKRVSRQNSSSTVNAKSCSTQTSTVIAKSYSTQTNNLQIAPCSSNSLSDANCTTKSTDKQPKLRGLECSSSEVASGEVNDENQLQNMRI